METLSRTPDDRVLVELAGRTWARVPGTYDTLESVALFGASVQISEARLRKLDEERRAERARLEKLRAEAARERAEFAARPRVVIGGVPWVRSSRDPDVLISTSGTVVMREATLRELEAERAAEAQLAAARNAPSPIEERLRGLEAELAAVRAASTTNRKK